MPKVKEGYYEGCSKKYGLHERQNLTIVEKILKDKDAYREFLTNVIVHITGSAKLDKLYLASSNYETVVTSSDEAYGLILLEDKSLLWREVLWRRTARYFGSGSTKGNTSLGVKQEVFIHDKYRDSFTIWSNKGILAPATKKGWSNEGVMRFNEYVDVIKRFRETEEGKQAMKEQRINWTSSLLVANRKRRSDMIESESPEIATAKVACYQEDWD